MFFKVILVYIPASGQKDSATPQPRQHLVFSFFFFSILFHSIKTTEAKFRLLWEPTFGFLLVLFIIKHRSFALGPVTEYGPSAFSTLLQFCSLRHLDVLRSRV